MGKLVFAINMTLDGYFDHTALTADDELHEKAAALMRRSQVLLFGRVMYRLMEAYWPAAAGDPSLSPAERDFAAAINRAAKIVFTNTLPAVSWNATIKKRVDPDDIRSLQAASDRDVLLCGGAELARTFRELDLIDEYRLVVHPTLLGAGRPLFPEGVKRKDLRLVGRDIRRSGAVELIYATKNASDAGRR